MHSILVVFVILLALLTLISALGGSLNLQEKFVDEEEVPSMPEMFYEVPTKEQDKPSPTPTPKPPTVPSTPPTPSVVSAATESFIDGKDIEPFEDEDLKYGSPL